MIITSTGLSYKDINGISPEASASLPELRVAVLNIMPDKVRTEKDIFAALPANEFDIHLDFIALETHTPSEKSAEHISKYYIPFSRIKENRYDALIITGAPLEMYPYSDVRYFSEFLDIVRWGTEGGASARMYICWAAFALLYSRYGIEKLFLPKKQSGVYPHYLSVPHPVMKDIDSSFSVPHSRNIHIDTKSVHSVPELNILAQSDVAGPHVLYDSRYNDFLVLGHWEYAPDTLDMEFNRDLTKGLNPEIPENYYISDNPAAGYSAPWVLPGKTFFRNFCHLALNEKK